MTILLINDNPLVSRLLALCARDNVVLEEVKGVHNIDHKSYDIVFIDERSYVGEVLKLSEIIHIGKKILLSSVNVEINDFDMTIQKPFLPSQIIEIFDGIEISQVDKNSLDETNIETVSIFPLESAEDNIDEGKTVTKSDVFEEEISTLRTQVLDKDELEKIKRLLEMDDVTEIVDSLSEEEIEIRKIEAIKEQLIADGLEIVREEEIVEELSASSDTIIFSNREKKSKNKNKSGKKEIKAKKKQKKSSRFTKQEIR